MPYFKFIHQTKNLNQKTNPAIHNTNKIIAIFIYIFMSNKKQNNVWYHGTPDVRELQQDGGFTQRHIEIEYVEDIDKWNSLQEPLNKARENNNQEEYTSLIKQRGDLRKRLL